MMQSGISYEETMKRLEKQVTKRFPPPAVVKYFFLSPDNVDRAVYLALVFQFCFLIKDFIYSLIHHYSNTDGDGH